MKHPGATILLVLGGILAAMTVTPVVMGVGALSPWLVALFLLGLVLIYAGSRMRRGDRPADGGAAEPTPGDGAPPTGDRPDEPGAREVPRDPSGTPTSPGVDEQDDIQGM